MGERKVRDQVGTLLWPEEGRGEGGGARTKLYYGVGHHGGWGGGEGDLLRRRAIKSATSRSQTSYSTHYCPGIVD